MNEHQFERFDVLTETNAKIGREMARQFDDSVRQVLSRRGLEIPVSMRSPKDVSPQLAQELRERVSLVKTPDGITTVFLDGAPVAEFHPITITHDSNNLGAFVLRAKRFWRAL